MIRINDETISKAGCRRRKLQNGLLQMVSRKELSEQLKLFGGMVDRWARNKQVTFIPLMHGAGYTWQRLMAGMSKESQHIGEILTALFSWVAPSVGQMNLIVRIHAFPVTDRDRARFNGPKMRTKLSFFDV
jgi:hypothetical protein